MDVNIESGWKKVLKPVFDSPDFSVLAEKVREEYANPRFCIYPPAAKIFAAFDLSPFDKTKVVIVGQDPYHGPGQANGLAFSVNPGIPIPPSLVNIFREVNADTGAPIPENGNLERWARQGVLLLNASLSVREHAPKSHAAIGWYQFTDAVIRILSQKREGIVFLLWGSDAIKKGAVIDRNKHFVLTAPHPSPLSAYRGFLGCRHFSAANAYLISHGEKPIIW